MIYHRVDSVTSRIVGSQRGVLLPSLAILFLAMPLLGGTPDLRLEKSNPGWSASSQAADFELIGQVESQGDARGGDYSLRAGCADRASSGGAGCPSCLCGDILFADGFESGDTGAWQ